MGLGRDLVHEIEGATQLAGLRVQWSWWSNFLNSRSHGTAEVFVRFVRVLEDFNAAPVADYDPVLALGQVFCQVAFSQRDSTAEGTVHDPSNFTV